MQERLNEQAEKTIQGLQDTVRQLWAKCCQEDGMPPETKFAVFSEGNKFVPFYEKALLELQEARASYAAGGYVGLRLPTRRGR